MAERGPDAHPTQNPTTGKEARVPGHVRDNRSCRYRIPKKTAAEKQALSAERDEHLDWLASRGLRVPWPLRSEDAYTGLLLAGLLAPETSMTVCQARGRGSFPSPPPWPVAGAVWPRWGADLVAWADYDDGAVALVVEHKHFESHFKCP